MSKKEKEIEELNKKIDRLQKTVDKLSESLYKHIKFIDSTYENLRNPIDAAKKWLGK
jgi:peptidoglycan hydrolase CwlO-like protein|tara:strand:- start:392 stop:562 length:171 start_codon:yes stop_codon:yes gene_type:complete